MCAGGQDRCHRGHSHRRRSPVRGAQAACVRSEVHRDSTCSHRQGKMPGRLALGASAANKSSSRLWVLWLQQLPLWQWLEGDNKLEQLSCSAGADSSRGGARVMPKRRCRHTTAVLRKAISCHGQQQADLVHRVCSSPPTSLWHFGQEGTASFGATAYGFSSVVAFSSGFSSSVPPRHGTATRQLHGEPLVVLLQQRQQYTAAEAAVHWAQLLHESLQHRQASSSCKCTAAPTLC